LGSIAILQPSYLPWIGFFEQVDRVDDFVYYDDVQYTKNDWRNRNKIKDQNGTMWLSVPVKFHLGDLIKDVLIDNSKPWKRKHINALKSNYSKSLYFGEVFPLIENILNKNHDKLLLLNIDLITMVLEYLSITTRMHLSSTLNISGNKNNRLINICNHFNASFYYSGEAAKSYLDEELFEAKGIEIGLQSFVHKHYVQQYSGDFIPYLSIIDLLFNQGKNSLKYIRNQGE